MDGSISVADLLYLRLPQLRLKQLLRVQSKRGDSLKSALRSPDKVIYFLFSDVEDCLTELLWTALFEP